MSLKDDFSFQGGLTGTVYFSHCLSRTFFPYFLIRALYIINRALLGTLSHLYAMRSKDDHSYGTGQKKQRVAQKDFNIWEKAIEVLDQSDAKEMSMLILILCGSFFAFKRM